VDQKSLHHFCYLINSQSFNMSQPNKEANILLALEAYRNNPKLGLQRAAKIYDIGYGTQRRWHNDIPCQRDSIPKSRKLSDLEEQTIVQFIPDLDRRGFPPELRGVEELANQTCLS
jgi:hypothetical protein